MHDHSGGARVYTIPADLDFTRTLARNILDGILPGGDPVPPDSTALANWTVFVPTRRAARALASAFLDEGGQTALVLPRIRPLGDVDDDELAAGSIIGGLGELDVDPPISGLHRQFLLAKLIIDWAERSGGTLLAETVLSSAAQALMLAQSLARLIDGFDNDEISLDVLETVFEGDLPDHRFAVLEFLKVVRQTYPAALKDLGLSGPVQHRSAMMRAQAELYDLTGHAGPVIAAGSTGSIAATAGLLRAISRLPNGAVVLPGLDLDLDDTSWGLLEQQHPQFGLRELLTKLGFTRQQVAALDHPELPRAGNERCRLISEIMRPAKTSERWHDVVQQQSDLLERATNGLKWINAPDRSDEARVIALLIRHSLETPQQTIQLVTPDRRLARQVKTELERWRIEVDDSAGEPLIHTSAGAFVALVTGAAASGLAPRELMALLDHPFCRFGRTREDVARVVRQFEISMLRGHPGKPSLDRLAEIAARRRDAVTGREHRLVRHMSDDDWSEVIVFCEQLAEALNALAELFATPRRHNLQHLIAAHLAAADTISAGDDASPLWMGEAGEALSTLFSGLLEHATKCPMVTPAEYLDFFTAQLAGVPVRPRHVRHPRVAILGLLEARLVASDVTILGGLNEGVWPAEAEIDPWLNRPQRTEAGLQLPERRIGLSAHDFAQAACGRRVWITSSAKIDGQPAVPARWLWRLLAVLQAAGLEDRLSPGEPWLNWVRGLDEPDGHAPVTPPAPAPPVDARPRRWSITAIDRLLKDPYGSYARYVLELEPLDSLETQIGARERGNIVHAALHRFAENHPAGLPVNAETEVLRELGSAMDTIVEDPAQAALWWPQFERMATWFVHKERDWRESCSHVLAEVRGELEFSAAGEAFTLSGIADRMDMLRDGRVRIIDYKTGQLPAKKPGSKAYSAQLELESHMVVCGAFAGLAASAVGDALYVRLTGRDQAGETSEYGDKAAAAGATAFDGLCDLLADYCDPEQPYLAVNASDRDERPFDFDHLSRWREWSHLIGDD